MRGLLTVLLILLNACDGCVLPGGRRDDTSGNDGLSGASGSPNGTSPAGGNDHAGGVSGNTGASGNTGTSGNTGASGQTGTSGSSGQSGATGSTGLPPAPAELSLTPLFYDFGSVPLGSTARAHFVVRNIGGETSEPVFAHVDAIPTWHGSTLDGCQAAPLGANATCTITLDFAPIAAGSIDLADVVVTSGAQTLVARARGRGAPESATSSVLLEPADLGILQPLIGERAIRTIAVTNRSKTPITAIEVGVLGRYYNAWRQGDSCARVDAAHPLAPGALCTASITFDPEATAKPGIESGVATIVAAGTVEQIQMSAAIQSSTYGVVNLITGGPGDRVFGITGTTGCTATVFCSTTLATSERNIVRVARAVPGPGRRLKSWVNCTIDPDDPYACLVRIDPSYQASATFGTAALGSYSIRVEARTIDGGAGTLRMDGALCAPVCTATKQAGDVVRLQAAPAGGSGISPWPSGSFALGGTCSRDATRCSFIVDSAVDITVDFLPLNPAFITSITFDGALIDANAACGVRAALRGYPHPERFVAWRGVAQQYTMLGYTITHSDGLLAHDYYSPLLGSPWILHDEDGALLGGEDAVILPRPGRCSAYTSTALADLERARVTDPRWIDQTSLVGSCAERGRLACLGTAYPSSVPEPATVLGIDRIAFVAQTPPMTYPGPGRLGLDTACRQAAYDGALCDRPDRSCRFAAVIAEPGLSAASAFVGEARVVNVRGGTVAKTTGAFFRNAWHAPLTTIPGSPYVVVGTFVGGALATDGYAIGDLATTCDGWMKKSVATYATPSYTVGLSPLVSGECTAPLPIACLSY